MAGAIGIAAVVVLALLVMFWEWLSGGDSGSTTIRNVALVLAGAAALGLAGWRSTVADRQSKTAQQGLLNERYQKGAEMLGSDVLSVRLAGIYALQRLATEHPGQYHLQVMRLFCAFVRLPTEDQVLESARTPVRPGSPLGLRQDVESVIDVIGSRDSTSIALEREADHILDLRGADLCGGRIFDSDLSGGVFHRANLSGMYVANTDFRGASFRDADLSKAQFFDVSFTGAHLSLANLSGAMLQGVELVRMNLHHVNLSGANLGGANLSGSILQYAKLSKAALDDANLSEASFLKADLSRSLLIGADLSGARVVDTDLTSANISDANLSGVQFSLGGQQPANGLTQSQLDQARADPENPPNLLGVLDAETNQQLVWHGRPL
ncbi:pentapeptide repeat-containing protein [Candidatus Poribacteria bacterium]|nr:pentapeptide repeat-containing protein [Candidatus Poribacteria bacterium]